MRALIISLALVGLAPIAASAQGAQSRPAQERQCFFSRDWQGWRATDDQKSMYIRVKLHDIWRVDFANSCPGLRSPNAHLVTKTQGSDNVCSAIDLDIKVSDPPGFSTPCIATGLRKLSPEEAKALPKRLQP